MRAHKVEVTYQGKTHNLEVPSDQTILEVALDQGIDLPHDCKLGVCMTCPAKLVGAPARGSGAALPAYCMESQVQLIVPGCLACTTTHLQPEIPACLSRRRLPNPPPNKLPGVRRG